MAKTIKSFNADDDVISIISQQEIKNFSQWANDMIKKGYASTKEAPKTQDLTNVKVVLN